MDFRILKKTIHRRHFGENPENEFSLAEYVCTRHAKPIRGIVDVSVFAEVDPWRKLSPMPVIESVFPPCCARVAGSSS